MAKGDLAKAVAEAVTESTEGSAPDDAAEGTATVEAPEAKEGAAADSKQVGTEVETANREDYDAFKAKYGVDLSILPDDDSRDKFVREFRETNKTINKLQRENAELKTQPPVVEPPAPAQPPAAAIDTSQLTDEQIAQALGIDFENLDDRDVREIGLTRTALETQARLEQLERGVTESNRTVSWEREFGKLEAQYGPLPDDIAFDDVLSYAKAQGISNPEAAYWAAVGPVRAAVSQALNEQIVQLRTASKKGATTLRPGTKADTEDKLQATNVKDGIKEAFEAARQKLGYEYTE